MSQEFNNNVVDIVKEKGLHLYDYMSDFQKFKEELPRKENFSNLLTDKKINGKEFEHILNFGEKFK